MPNISVINRALMVGQYQQGATMQTIANRFNVTKSTVCKIIHKHRKTGDVIDRERTGRVMAVQVVDLVGISQKTTHFFLQH